MLDDIFDTSALKQFMPHGMCLLWRTDLLLLHVVSDSLIALSYYSIPIALIYFALKRTDLQFRWILILFGIFILACGSTHLMQIWTIWRPDYIAEGFIKLFTALVSMGTAIALWPLIPLLLKIPSPSTLKQTNLKLQHEIEERERHENQVTLLNNNLEKMVQERTQELISSNQRLEREIHDRKHVEAALRDGDRRKDEFLATLAHELRNPLAPIRNAVELLKLQPDRVEQVHELINRQLYHLTHLVDDLLDVARITSGQIKLKKTIIDMRDIVKQATETLLPLLESRGHQLVVSMPQHPLPLEADPVRLTQVIGNLLDNAAKYTERGGRIELSVEQVEGDAVVTVRDTGIGIAAEMLPRIFDLFAQGDRSANLAQGGLGLGLTLVRRLVEMHGGSVKARSDGIGLGSQFIVRFPLLSDSARREPLPASLEERHACQSQRVLVVDDNPDSADSLKLLLQAVGYEVHAVYSGKAALEDADLFVPEIVVMDIGMPGMSGYEAAQRLREKYPPEQMVLIAVSGYGQEQDRRHSRLAGFDHHLLKPVDFQELTRLMANAA